MFYVNLGQISDIIWEEEWLHGEVNCLCNIALSRIISLTWGQRRRSQRIHIIHAFVWVTVLLWQIMAITGNNLLKFVALTTAQK